MSGSLEGEENPPRRGRERENATTETRHAGRTRYEKHPFPGGKAASRGAGRQAGETGRALSSAVIRRAVGGGGERGAAHRKTPRHPSSSEGGGENGPLGRPQVWSSKRVRGVLLPKDTEFFKQHDSGAQ